MTWPDVRTYSTPLTWPLRFRLLWQFARMMLLPKIGGVSYSFQIKVTRTERLDGRAA